MFCVHIEGGREGGREGGLRVTHYCPFPIGARKWELGHSYVSSHKGRSSHRTLGSHHTLLSGTPKYCVHGTY